jgi:EmrB/QacA subfamily drug resistance transporter
MTRMDEAESAAAEQPFVWTRRHTLAIAVLVPAQLVEAMDITVVNVALPTIKVDLGFDPADLQWVVNAYAVLFAGFLLLGGRAGDLLGRRRVFLAGMSVFTAASLLSALAPNAGTLVGGRAIQGLAAGFTSPMTLAILASIFPDGPARNRALAIWGATTGVSASLGLIVGGLLVNGLAWQWIFYINIPIGVVMVVLAARFIPNDKPAHRHSRFDTVGAISATAGLVLLTYALVQTNDHPWGSGRTIGLLAAAAVLLAYFCVHEVLVAAEPLVPFSLLRNRTVAGANVVSALSGSGLIAIFYFTSLYQQQVLHFSALKTGLAYLPFTTTIIGLVGLGPLLVPRLGIRYTVALGALISGVGMLLLTRVTPSGHLVGSIIVPTLVLSLGLALLFIPMTIAAISGVAPSQNGVASGLVTVTRTAGASLGLAVMSTLAAARTTHLGNAGAGPADALTGGFRVAFGISAGLMVATAVAALVIFRDEGRGEKVNMAELSQAGIDA